MRVPVEWREFSIEIGMPGAANDDEPFAVRVSAGGGPAGELRARGGPSSDKDEEESWLGRDWPPADRFTDPRETDPREAGTELAEWLLPCGGAGRTALVERLAALGPNPEVRLRVRLVFDAAALRGLSDPDYVSLPWEALYFPKWESEQNRPCRRIHSAFLALNPCASIVRARAVEPARALPAAVDANGIRVLLVYANSARQPIERLPGLLKTVREALQPLAEKGLVRLHVLTDATPEAVLAALRTHNPHVLITACHGQAPGNGAEPDLALVLRSEAGGEAPLYACAIRDVLSGMDEPALRAAVMPDCWTAWAGPPFAEAGVAVLGLSAPIGDQLVVNRLVEVLFGSLARFEGLDQCVLDTREKLHQEGYPAWCLPVLWPAGADGPVFESRTEDEVFERHYRNAVRTRLDRMELFGIDVDDVAKRYPLSIAYVRLRMSESKGGGPGADAAADAVLAPLEMATILGRAGSGKSTLLQWLAVRAAAGDLTGPMAAWNERIPFFIQLRQCVSEMRRAGKDGKPPSPPPLDEWVALLSRNLAGSMPTGWVTRQVRSGRVLLLVDGVDEVPADLRGSVREWIDDLRRLGVRFVMVSSRFLGSAWLRDYRQFQVAPLDVGTAFELVTRWHAAIGEQETDPQRRERLPGREAALKKALEQHGPLRELVTNPLLCAMICALHHRDVDLPRSRVPLYDRCCSALIVERERLRGIELPEPVRWMTPQHKMMLLERLAYWLVCQGRVDVLARDVDGWLETQRRDIPQWPPDVSPGDVRSYFVQRSGLLCEPVAGESLEFVHKTFLEFLAARAAVKGEAYEALAKHAGDDTWTELIRLAAGCIENKQRSTQLLNALLRPAGGWLTRLLRPWSAPEPRRALLAVSCLETCVLVEEPMKERLERLLAGLVPPRSQEASDSLAAAGTLALPHIAASPGQDDDSRAWCVRTLARIGGDGALRLLADYAEEPDEPTRRELVRGWSAFEPRDYARRVLASALNGQVSFRPTGVVSLAGLEALDWLEELDLSDCPGVTDLSPVFELMRRIQERGRDGAPALQAGPGDRELGRDGAPALRRFVNKDGAELVWVPSGEFMMGGGDDDPEARGNEKPTHRVEITRGFWLYRTPVTNAQYRRFLQATQHREPDYWREERFNGDEQPVVGLDWNDAMAYCAWVGMRLPTEAEWEYAARGPESRRYPWGNERPTPERADYGHGGGPLPVGSKPDGAAWCGAQDLAGCVWEWCSDWYGEDYYANSPSEDPEGQSNGSYRVLRGGSWCLDACFLRASSRFGGVPDRRHDIRAWGGFRPARTP